MVRHSKFRHNFGTEGKSAKQWSGIRIPRANMSSGLLAANHKFVSCIWDSAGGGSFIVLNLDNPHKIDRNKVSLVKGHKRAVLDTSWNPFNGNIIGSCSEDNTAMIWKIPEGGLTESIHTPVQTLKGHGHKVSILQWHPTAENVLATLSCDNTVKVWDVSKGNVQYTVSGYGKEPTSICWNRNGSLFVTAAKDKKARIHDPRSDQLCHEWVAHEGAKGFSTAWVTLGNRIATVGHDKSSRRELKLWDLSDLSKPVGTVGLGIAPSSMLCWYDQDLSILYVGGKGDSSIKYFEVIEDSNPLFPLSEFKSTKSQKGLCQIPKYACNVNESEISRFLKLDNNGNIIPISITVPRKSESFQPDIFPDTAGFTPAHDAEDWFGGADVDPVLIGLENIDLGTAATAEFHAEVSLEEQLKIAKNRILELEEEIKRLKA